MCVESYVFKMCACFVEVARRENSYFDITAQNLAIS